MAETVFKCAYRTLLADGVVLVNTFHIGTEDASSAQTCLEALNDGIHSDFLAVLPTTATLLDATSVEVPLDSTPLPTPDAGFLSFSEAGGRSIATHSISPAMGLLAQLKTGVAGRRARGRCWLPPCLDSTELTADGTFDTGGGSYYSLCSALITTYVTHSYDDGVQPVVYSKTAALADAANVWFAITSFLLPNKQHWLRSRDLPGP